MNKTYKQYKHLNLRIGSALLLFLATFTVGQTVYMMPSVVFTFADIGNTLDLPDAARTALEVAWEIVYGGIYLFSFMIAVPFFYIISRGQKTESMHLRFKLSSRLPLFIAAGVGINFIFAYINYYLTLPINVSALMQETIPSDMKIYEMILQTIVIAIVPAFCEEFLFRGMILSNLLPYGRTTAIIASAVCFAFMHQNPAQLLYTFVAGLMLGYVFVESGSIWGGVIFHFVNNLVSVIEQVIVAKNPNHMAEFYDGILVMGIMLLGMICTAILLMSYLARRKKEKTYPTDVDNGIFGRELKLLPDSIGARLPIRRKMAGFFSPTMIIFLALTGVSMLAAVIMGLTL